MTQILVQTKQAELREGESFTFANLLYTRSGMDRMPRELRALNERAWMVTGEPLALVGLGPQEIGDLQIDAGMFMLTPDRLMAADARRIALLGSEWQAAQPTSLDVRFDAGPVSPESESQRAAQVAKTATGQVRDLLEGLLKDSPAPAAPGAPSRPQIPTIKTLWRTEMQSAVRALAAAEPAILCGTDEGQVALLDSTGNIVWQREVGSPVRCVTLARFAADRWACVAGTSAGDVRALDATTGEERWTYACQPFGGRSGSVATVFAADLDGDGLHEVIAGSDNQHYHALSSAGELLWRTNTVHASTVGCAGDLTGDGRDDVVAGTEYYWPRLLNSAGKQIINISAGPVTTAVSAFDLDGDGNAEAFIGMDDAFVRCARPDEHEVWAVNVGGSPTAIEPLDVDGDGKPEVVCSSEGFSVYAFGSDGAHIWRTQLPDAVNDLAVVGDRLLAACDDGRVYLLDREGDLLGACDVGQRPSVLTHSGEGKVVAAVGHALVGLSTGPASQ
jgi:outer membrane protein assembly factor BamB